MVPDRSLLSVERRGACQVLGVNAGGLEEKALFSGESELTRIRHEVGCCGGLMSHVLSWETCPIVARLFPRAAGPRGTCFWGLSSPGRSVFADCAGLNSNSSHGGQQDAHGKEKPRFWRAPLPISFSEFLW